MNLPPVLQNDVVFLRSMTRLDYNEVYSVAKDPLIWEQHPDRKRYLPEFFKKYFDDMMAFASAFVEMDKSTDWIIGCTRFRVIEELNSTIEIKRLIEYILNDLRILILNSLSVCK